MVAPRSGEGILLFKYFTIIYHKTNMIVPYLEKKKNKNKKDLCKAPTGVW